jgi:hypothetical protein
MEELEVRKYMKVEEQGRGKVAFSFTSPMHATSNPTV